MKVINIIKERRTIRKFIDKKIPKKTILKIIEAGSFAPSACNKQAWEFIIIENEDLKEKLAKETNFKFIKDIPTTIFVLYDSRISEEKQANIQSASAAIQNMLLYSYSIGIGSWWLAAYGDEKKVREILKIPENMTIVATVGFGYYKEMPKTPKRRPLKDIIHFDEFKKKIKSDDPDDWSFNDIAEYASRSIRATSPHIGYRYFFENELKNYVNFLTMNLKGNNIFSLFDCNGIELFEIAKKLEDKNFLSYVFSIDIAKWLEERRKNQKIKNIKFKVGNEKIDISNGSFDSILCLNVLNRICNREKIIERIYKILRPKGELFVSIFNKSSFHGIYSKKRIGHFGPEKALNVSDIKKLLEKKGFTIEKIVGFDLFPSKKILESRSGFLGETKFIKFHRIIKLITSDRLESFETESILRNFCRLIVFQCKK